MIALFSSVIDGMNQATQWHSQAVDWGVLVQVDAVEQLECAFVDSN